MVRSDFQNGMESVFKFKINSSDWKWQAHLCSSNSNNRVCMYQIFHWLVKTDYQNKL